MDHYDVIVLGSGPAGQKAAIQGAKAGKRIALIERDNRFGGACVYRGTIPSKTLRENALQLARFEQSAKSFSVNVDPEAPMTALLSRLQKVLDAHDKIIRDQLQRNGVECLYGRASFADARTLNLQCVDGTTKRISGDNIIIATGSRPRDPEHVPVDHEHILDSDSVLAMCYLPRSMTVLGSGVIACEYASIFAILGVKVTMVDKWERPLGFLDAELSDRFMQTFAAFGGQFIGRSKAVNVVWDGFGSVVTTLEDGEQIQSDKMLVALGRIANLESLSLEKAGLVAEPSGLLAADEHCQTEVPHIYAVGDVIGAPALASSSMEQGRRAVAHALGLPIGSPPETIPAGIYSIPEISSVGLTEAQAREKHGAVTVGYARFDEVARGQIAGIQDGLLKMVADAEGQRVLGVQIVGEGATELIHLGQMALIQQLSVDAFVDNIFNFPTLAEAYRVAALAIASQRSDAAVPVGQTSHADYEASPA